jgi:hypothetical protein
MQGQLGAARHFAPLQRKIALNPGLELSNLAFGMK